MAGTDRNTNPQAGSDSPTDWDKYQLAVEEERSYRDAYRRRFVHHTSVVLGLYGAAAALIRFGGADESQLIMALAVAITFAAATFATLTPSMVEKAYVRVRDWHKFRTKTEKKVLGHPIIEEIANRDRDRNGKECEPPPRLTAIFFLGIPILVVGWRQADLLGVHIAISMGIGGIVSWLCLLWEEPRPDGGRRQKVYNKLPDILIALSIGLCTLFLLFGWKLTVILGWASLIAGWLLTIKRGKDWKGATQSR